MAAARRQRSPEPGSRTLEDPRPLPRRRGPCNDRGRPALDFDDYAADYRDTLDRSLAFSGEGHAWFARRKAEFLEELARTRFSGPVRVLDVGCGPGLVLEALDSALFGLREGTDVSHRMLQAASARLPQCDFSVCAPDGTLPFADDAFDLTFTSCTLHHVPADQQPRFLDSLARVTRPGGLVAVFEHNPWNPVTRAVVAGCEFDRDAVLLSAPRLRSLMLRSGLEPEPARYYLFAPPRWAALRFVDRLAHRVPLGAQYLVVAKVPE